jgi:hypothetical protein
VRDEAGALKAQRSFAYPIVEAAINQLDLLISWSETL